MDQKTSNFVQIIKFAVLRESDIKKIPLIFIPGLLCDQALWQPQIVALSELVDCRVTDQHMHTDTIGQIADGIVADAPAQFALAGLSMGGYIALEICRKYGERVKGLALLDTSARPDTPEQTNRRKNMMVLCQEQNFNKIIEMLLPVLIHPDRQEDQELKQQIIDMAVKTGSQIFLRQQHAIINRIDQRPSLSKIACPTVVICGQQDCITPLDCALEMSEKIHQSKLETIKDCGHLSTMEKPEQVTKIMTRWLMGLK
jgi:pimeloyl-ACP methyl ester carboxylesterase